MPKFVRMNTNDVQIGRGRAATEARKPYLAAIQAGDAGQIELGRGEVAATVKRRLSEAAHALGIKVRSSWADANQRTLLWKKTSPPAVRTPRSPKTSPRRKGAG